MTPDPIQQWLALNQSALNMCKQIGEASSTGVTKGPAPQAQMAQLMKAMMNVSQQWRALQSETCVGMMHSQLNVFKPRALLAHVQALTDMQRGVSDSLNDRRSCLASEIGSHADACIQNLQKAQTRDDVTMVFEGFLGEIVNSMRDDSAQKLTLLNSAAAAATIFAHKTLDDMIGAEQGS